jgi:hypothetical protein
LYAKEREGACLQEAAVVNYGDTSAVLADIPLSEITEPTSAIHVMQQRQRAICKYTSLSGDVTEMLIIEVGKGHMVPSGSFDAL